MLRRALIALICLTGALGCKARRGDGCERAFAAKEYETAATACADAYAADRGVGPGVLATRALAALGRDDEVLAWAERLGDDPAAAAAWRAAAAVHGRREHREATIAARTRALELWQRAGALGEAAYEAHKLWQLHWHASELLPALRFARRSYDLAARSDDAEMKLVAFTSLFTALDEIGDTGAARALLARADALLDPSDATVRFYTRFYAGQLYYGEGRLELARAAYEQALALANDADDETTARAARFNLADVCLSLGCLEVAAGQLPQVPPPDQDRGPAATAHHYYAARIARARGDLEAAERRLDAASATTPIPDWRWRLELERGRLREQQQRPEDAAGAYTRAIAEIEALRSAMKLDDLKLSVLERKRAPYERLFRLHARAGRVAEALAVAERARARTFVEAFVHASRAPQPQPDAAAEAFGDTAELRLVGLESLGATLTASPVVEPRPFAEVAAAVDGLQLLVYLQADDELWAYHQAGARGHLERLDASVATIERAIERLEASLDDPEAAAHLAGLLAPPSWQPATGTLYIVPDGSLGRVPFAMLPLAGRPLVAHHDLAYVPSLTALARLREPETQPLAPPVVIGAPETGGPALPGAREELTRVARALGVEPQVGGRARIAALEGAADAGLLHVASHGGLSPRGAWIELADGRLYASDVIARRVRPAVVVLASCASGARRGKDMWGAMGASFLAAGSRTVVAALWSVRDDHTRDFISAFYGHEGAIHPVRALAETQRAYLARGAPPSAWAAFVAFGGAAPGPGGVP